MLGKGLHNEGYFSKIPFPYWFPICRMHSFDPSSLQFLEWKRSPPPQYCKSSNRSMRLSQVSILEMMPCRKCITLVISFWVMPASSRLLRMKAMMALYLLLWILLILEWFKSVTVWCYRPVTNTNLNIQTKYHTFRWNHFNIVVMPSTMYSFRLSHPAWKKSNLKKSGSSLLPLNVTLINSYLFQNFIFFFTELLCTHINTLPF